MTAPGDVPLTTLMTLVEVFETENFERASHVKASACAGVAFLACHPIGAEGDECMNGPYRTKLLEVRNRKSQGEGGQTGLHGFSLCQELHVSIFG